MTLRPFCAEKIVQSVTITERAVADLSPYQNNPRTHSKKQIRQIADSIKTFGWTNPILVDADGGVIAGHGRLAAAKLLSMSHVPTLRIDWMGAAQKRAYILADNKLAENAGWDADLLAIELQGQIDLDIDVDLDFDIGIRAKRQSWRMC